MTTQYLAKWGRLCPHAEFSEDLHGSLNTQDAPGVIGTGLVLLECWERAHFSCFGNYFVDNLCDEWNVKPSSELESVVDFFSF